MSCGRKIGPYDCCSVVQGDCLELMKALPDGCVDAVITDPPYGVAIADWDDMSPREFARFTMGWLAEAARVGEEIAAFGVADCCLKQLLELLYPRVRTMIWDKIFVCGGAAERGLFHAFECVFHGYKPESFAQPKDLAVGDCIKRARATAGLSRGAVDMAIRGKKTGLCFRWEEGACIPSPDQIAKLKQILPLNGDLDSAVAEAYAAKRETLKAMSESAAEIHDVFRYRTVSNADHPTKKPTELMGDLVGSMTLTGATILDPFCGSGTTLVAAAKLGRHFLGFEISPEYCEIARKRIAAVEAQPNLFQPKPQQLSLEAE